MGPPPRAIVLRLGARRRPASRRRTSIVGTSEASVTSPASSVRLTRSASKRSWRTAVVWLIAQRTSTPRPPTWWSGSGQSQRSPGSTPRASAEAAALAAWLPKVSSTGLGSPVVPEVWMTVKTASGSWEVRSGTSAWLGPTAGWGGWASSPPRSGSGGRPGRPARTPPRGAAPRAAARRRRCRARARRVRGRRARRPAPPARGPRASPARSSSAYVTASPPATTAGWSGRARAALVSQSSKPRIVGGWVVSGPLCGARTTHPRACPSVARIAARA